MTRIAISVLAIATSLATPLLGQYVYVANGAGGVSGYHINYTTGALTEIAGSPFFAIKYPIFVTVDPKNKFAYVLRADACCGGGILRFAINPATGALLPTGTTEAGIDPQLMTIDPTGK